MLQMTQVISTLLAHGGGDDGALFLLAFVPVGIILLGFRKKNATNTASPKQINPAMFQASNKAATEAAMSGIRNGNASLTIMII